MDVFDLLLAPFYLFIVLFIAYKYKAKHEHKNVAFKYFIPGLVAKIVGAISLGLIYTFYYGGGDTINYFNTASTFADLFLSNSSAFYHLYFETPSPSEVYLMRESGVFTYWINDPYAFFASKFFFPFVLIGAKSYVCSSILVASFCFIFVWKLFLVFVNEFPEIYRSFALSILFMPSVIFWGSGLMKDSITFSAACYYVFGFYWFFVIRKYNLSNILALLISTIMLLAIKPYILFALLPGSIFWLVTTRISRIKNALLKLLIAPAILILGGFIVLLVMNNLGDKLGKYSIDKVFETAQVSQNDLKQSYYKGNTFDIGSYDASVGGLLSVAHKAIFATLFRPSIIDVRNIVMLISALENTFLLLMTIYLLVKLRVYKIFALINSHPIVLFSFFFSIFFAFSVGVSISNFGTLVRLKIPCIPFFTSSLLILTYLVQDKKIKYKTKEAVT